MLRSASVAALLVLPFLAGTAPASGSEMAPACGRGGCSSPDGGGSDADAEDGGVSITVWGSGTTDGEDGRFEIPAETVWVLPACRYIPTLTGKEYYELIEEGGYPPPRDRPEYGFEDYEVYQDYEKYKDDDEGRWWAGACFSGDFDGDLDEFFDHTEEFFDDYDGAVFVEVDEEPPVPPVPPEVLVDVAYDHMELPDPEISWNPQRESDSATLVNVDTWLWLDEGPVQLEVNAEAGGNTARAEAALSSMSFSASSADPVTCAGTGVEWSPEAASGCSLTFNRSSANQPGQVTPVTAQSLWTIEWFANAEPRGELDPQTTSAVFDIPVAENQTNVASVNS
ncbi:hypothetical protein [Phytoactinopolyspora endophytica]|uniref:hypothetical protein n=1 Tax=Phytoactinopolyspora endophytica TaxID=1642495 RepID=UPI00101D5D42|nr:hypothetical protein [Phytoactinopolyspora endophytica]